MAKGPKPEPWVSCDCSKCKGKKIPQHHQLRHQGITKSGIAPMPERIKLMGQWWRPEEEGAANAHLIAAVPDMLAMLEELEWSDFDQRSECFVCPLCLSSQDEGHDADCKLGNLLKRIKGEK